MRIQDRRTYAPVLCLATLAALLCAALLAAQGAPGATVTGVNEKTGVVTGKVNSTGQVFTFTLANKASLSKVRPGQGIFVNLGKKQVSLDGKQPQGTILTLLPLGIKPGGSGSASSGSTSSGSSGNSGGSTTSGNSNPQPVSFSCGGTSNPPSADTCGKSAGSATNFGITMVCGASITMTGNSFPAGVSDWLTFTVPASRANCSDYSGRTPSSLIQVSISSSPAGIVFDGFTDAAGTPIPTNPTASGPGNSIVQGQLMAILGVNQFSPLPVGTYYLRIHGINASTTGTWTLTITG